MSVNSADLRYVAQVLVLSVVLGWFAASWLRDAKPRIVALLYVAYWSTAVSVLYLWRSEQQAFFYSSDQVEMLRNVERIYIKGLNFSVESLLGQRYIVSVPAFVLSYIGIEPILAYKFFQALSVLLLVVVTHSWAKSHGYELPTWIYGLVIGPSILLNSILALRDTVLAAGVAALFLQRSLTLRALALVVVSGLRPQLGVACAIGIILGELISLRRRPIFVACIGLTSYSAGALLFHVGVVFLSGPAGELSAPLSQRGISRLLLSLLGLQFLSVDPDTVDLNLRMLIPLRLLFFDTWLIPFALTLAILLSNSTVKAHWRLCGSLFVALTLYFGIASQTDMTSSRQTLPFFATAGLVAWVLLTQPRRQSHHHRVPVLPHLRAES